MKRSEMAREGASEEHLERAPATAKHFLHFRRPSSCVEVVVESFQWQLELDVEESQGFSQWQPGLAGEGAGHASLRLMVVIESSFAG